MKFVYPIIILSILSVSGCSNNGSENALKKENEQLRIENEKLSVANEELENDLKIINIETSRKNEKLNNEISSLQAGNESQMEIINRYQNVLEFPLSSNRTIADTLSIFSPGQVDIGNRIAGLIVSDKKEEPINDATSYHVKFTGEFEVTGSIFHSISGGSKYSFIVTENLETMPHTLNEFERGSIYFNIENEDDLLKSLGDQLTKLPEDGQLDIVAVFKNFSYNYVPETDFPNFAEFVRLVEE